MRKISILGSTGSIGRNTLRVVEALNGDFKVAALGAGTNVKLLAQQGVKGRAECSRAQSTASEAFSRLKAGKAQLVLIVLRGED